MALALLVYALTGSGLGVAGVVIAEIIPVLTLAPLAGALVDRLPGVRVMIGADLGRAALAFVLPFIDGHVVAVYAVAFGLAAGGVFFNPASQAVLPSLVDERDLIAANSGVWTAAVVSLAVSTSSGPHPDGLSWPHPAGRPARGNVAGRPAD